MIKRRIKPEELYKLRKIIDYQIGLGAGEALLPSISRVEVTVSPNTMRIRNVYVDGRLAFSIRASDSKILLHIYGGKLLMESYKRPPRVVVVNEVAPYIVEGGNVFARHVLSIDEWLRAGDEVIVVDELQNLIAVGTLRLSPEEALFFTRGEAVRVRDTIKELR